MSLRIKNSVKIDYSFAQPVPHNDVLTCGHCGHKQSQTIYLLPNRATFWTCKSCESVEKYVPSNSIEND